MEQKIYVTVSHLDDFEGSCFLRTGETLRLVKDKDNPYDDEAQLDIRIPREVIGANEKDDVVLKDIWNKKGGKMRLSTDGIIHINITRDHIAGGGLSVFEIKYE